MFSQRSLTVFSEIDLRMGLLLIGELYWDLVLFAITCLTGRFVIGCKAVDWTASLFAPPCLEVRFENFLESLAGIVYLNFELGRFTGV